MISYLRHDHLVRGDREPGARYDEDLLLANWNPALAALVTFHAGEASGTAHQETQPLLESDLDGFLDRVYALASHT